MRALLLAGLLAAGGCAPASEAERPACEGYCDPMPEPQPDRSVERVRPGEDDDGRDT